jgi:hypothetical protein
MKSITASTTPKQFTIEYPLLGGGQREIICFIIMYQANTGARLAVAQYKDILILFPLFCTFSAMFDPLAHITKNPSRTTDLFIS